MTAKPMNEFKKVLNKAVEAKLKIINEQKEELITAWVAKYGWDPEACKLVQQDKDGVTYFWIEPHGDRCLTHRNEILELRQECDRLRHLDKLAREWLAQSDTPIASASADADMRQFIQTRKAREAYRKAAEEKHER